MNILILSSLLRHLGLNPSLKKEKGYICGGKIFSKPTDTEFTEEADCTHKLPEAGKGGC